MSAFSENLRQLRKERGLSLEQLANYIGVSKSSINMYERGEREPSFETTEAIADFFNVNLDYLLGRENSPALDHESGGFSINPKVLDIAMRIEQLPEDVREKFLTAIDVLLASQE